jgi:hypothetical protein
VKEKKKKGKEDGRKRRRRKCCTQKEKGEEDLAYIGSGLYGPSTLLVNSLPGL